MLINQVHASSEYIICHYWYFLGKRFKFQSLSRNGCHFVLMMPIDVNSISILNFHRFYYCYIISGISKDEAVNVLIKVDLNEKNKKKNHYKICLRLLLAKIGINNLLVTLKMVMIFIQSI